ncbi:MAG: hypothetical protein ACI4TK_19785 [Agathobacter sp.]
MAGNYVLDGAVLRNIALHRGVSDVTEYSSLNKKTRDLLRADVLYSIYLSPNVWASDTKSHGAYTRTVGSQTIYTEDKENLYNIAYGIYKKYDDEMLEELESTENGLQWLDLLNE